MDPVGFGWLGGPVNAIDPTDDPRWSGVGVTIGAPNIFHRGDAVGISDVLLWRAGLALAGHERSGVGHVDVDGVLGLFQNGRSRGDIGPICLHGELETCEALEGHRCLRPFPAGRTRAVEGSEPSVDSPARGLGT